MVNFSDLVCSLKFYLQAALHGLLRNKLRTFLSSLGIIFGVASVITMLAVAKGASKEVVSGISQLGLNNILLRAPGKTATLPRGLESLIEKSGISQKTALVARLNRPVKDLKRNKSVEVIAVTPSFRDIYGITMAYGRFIHASDAEQGARVCVIGAESAGSLGLQYSKGGTIALGDDVYRVVGRLAPRAWAVSKKGSIQIRNLNQSVMVPLDKRLYGRVSELIVQARSGVDVPAAAMVLKRLLKIKGIKAQIIVPLALRNQALKSKRIFDIVLGTIAAVSLIIGGIGISNVMLASVAERNTEIGLRRTFGAAPSDILKQFLSEAALMGFAGSLAGMFLGLVASFTVNRTAELPVSFSPGIILTALLMGLLTATFASMYPAFKASRIDPLSAIRANAW